MTNISLEPSGKRRGAWKQLKIGDKMEYWVRFIRFPFAAMAGAVFLAQHIDDFKGSKAWLGFLFASWGLAWIIGGAYLDVKEGIRVIDRAGVPRRSRSKFFWIVTYVALFLALPFWITGSMIFSGSISWISENARPFVGVVLFIIGFAIIIIADLIIGPEEDTINVQVQK